MADKIKKLKEDRIEKLERFEELTDKAQSRKLSNDEKAELMDLETEIASIDAELKPLISKEKSTMRRFSELMGGVSEDCDDNDPRFSFEIQKKAKADPRRPISDWVLRNFDVNEDVQKADVFEVIAGLAGRKKISRAAQAAMATIKAGVTGTATLTEFLSARLWEVGLAKSHLATAGMQVFMMDEPSVRFARISEYPDMEWLAALATSTERDITFDSVDGTAATLRGFVTAGAELLQDGHNINQGIRRAFTAAIGTEVTRAGCWGSGSGEEPLGIRNYVGVPTYELDDQITSYAPFVNAQKLVYDENGPDHDTAIMAPDAWAQIQNLVGTNEGNPVQPPPALAHWRYLQTSNAPQTEAVPANNSSIVQGGFSSLHLGIRLNTTITVSPIASSTYSYSILGAFRGQFFAERIEDFAVITKVHRAVST
jgi:HK97 family phage major capsid protein